MTDPRYLLLATDDAAHGKNSGYTHLADYLPGAKLLKARRAAPQGMAQRGLVKVMDMFAGTAWYRLGSLEVEWRAMNMLRGGFGGLVHLLWGDRDWGFMDYFTRRAGVPLFATFHCCPDTLPGVLHHPARLRRLDGIILMSENQRPFFLASGVLPERIHVIHHGIDCGFFSPENRAKGGAFRVLSVGNYRRNFSRLVEVCRRLADDAGIRISVIAPPQHRGKFRDLPNVDFHSDLSDEELREAYRSASCLLMTLDAATANNAVLEAMACGLPIISEDVGGIAEYAGRDGAVLCPAGSIDALVAAVHDLRRKPDLAAGLGVRSRARAEELDWPRVGERTMKFYADMLARFPV